MQHLISDISFHFTLLFQDNSLLTDIIFEASKREESKRNETATTDLQQEANENDESELSNRRVLKAVKIVNFDFEDMDGQVNSPGATITAGATMTMTMTTAATAVTNATSSPQQGILKNNNNNLSDPKTNDTEDKEASYKSKET